MALADDLAIYALGYYMHESHPVRLDHLCLNTVQRRNPCDICGTVCPKGLSIYESKPDWHGCINCNLCVSACPTEAIHESSSSFAALTAALDSATDAIVFGCPKAQGHVDVTVPCLAALPWEVLATAALTRTAVVKTHPCKECDDQASFDEVKDLLRTLRRFFGKEEFARRVLSAEPKDCRAARGALRRQAFGSAVGALAAGAEAAVNPGSVTMSHYRAMLVEALESLPDDERPQVTWPTLEEDGNCQGCEICVRICPHHAIELRIPGQAEYQELREAEKRAKRAPRRLAEGEAPPMSVEEARAAYDAAVGHARKEGIGQALIHDASLCTQCGLCYMTCPNENLGGWDAITTANVPALVEHPVSLRLCEKCGRAFKPEGDEVACKACSRVNFF